jgi:hypothetical protein
MARHAGVRDHKARHPKFNSECYDNSGIVLFFMSPIIPASHIYTLRVFSPALRVLLLAIAVCTVVFEIIPIPGLSPLLFYSYKGSKVILFLLLGLCTPLALWRFDSINRGLAFGAVSAAIIEVGQMFVAGHRFSIFELLAKLVLILIGFVFAMNALYERKIRIFDVEIHLVSDHLAPRD